MKKIMLVGFAILFLLAVPTTHVSAADVNPYQIDRCENEEGEISTTGDVCHIRYDIVNSVLQPGQTDTTTSTNPLVGLQKIANMIWAGIVKPAGDNYALGTILSKPYGKQVEDASLQDLTPAKVQDVTVSNPNPMKHCVTSRLCVVNPLTGESVGNFVTEETWCTSDDIPGWVEQNDGTQRLASYTTRYVNFSNSFAKADIRVQKFTPPPCTERAEGDALDQTVIKTFKENRFGEENKTSIPYTITADMVTEKTIRNRLGELITQFIAKFPVPARWVSGGKVPYAGHVLCNGAGCSKEDLDPVVEIDSAKKQTLQQGGGWINSMYRNDAMDPNYNVGLNLKYIGQEFEALFTEVNTTDTTVYAMRRTEEAQTFANCSLLTEEEQKLSINSALNCNKSWLKPVSTDGEWNCNSNAPATANASSNDGGKAYADKVYGSCSSGTDNAWAKCKADVVARATKACVDPTFTLAIWLHESGASNYKCGKQLTGQLIEDFGIHNSPSAPPGDLSKQLDAFLKLPDAYAARCPGKTMQDFVSMYWIGDGCYNTLSSPDKAKIDGYIGELEEIYASVAPGKSLPTWPKGSCAGSAF